MEALGTFPFGLPKGPEGKETGRWKPEEVQKRICLSRRRGDGKRRRLELDDGNGTGSGPEPAVVLAEKAADDSWGSRPRKSKGGTAAARMADGETSSKSRPLPNRGLAQALAGCAQAAVLGTLLQLPFPPCCRRGRSRVFTKGRAARSGCVPLLRLPPAFMLVRKVFLVRTLKLLEREVV